jgi:hypothetical protein
VTEGDQPPELLTALGQAIEATAQRDANAIKTARNIRLTLYAIIGLTLIGMIATGILAWIVVDGRIASTNRSRNFETVLVCDADAQRAVALNQIALHDGSGTFIVPANCKLPK